ncbi:UDP-N-acetylmuramoyl-L-alanyl-D-glutamate--2,6-diaminopimelate ligase [Ananas comosus]|uniref:UDP-N-acetylmuramoyl-L-alanyl-D-glutamate--2, 6-diaminopimelate ligase n=1 Tax=Ananas comosus TaxID=4615 RepID=A0A199VFT6_ANACO|nr:UDP-N-acetylmuramoyl-L-alanyl-D-glutamate--2,6-diaminopimelate ligase [Ananas comosus]
MALPFTSLIPSTASLLNSPLLFLPRPSLPHLPPPVRCRRGFSALSAVGGDGKFEPRPSDDDPPEAPEDSSHGLSRFQQLERHVERARRREDAQLRRDQPLLLSALGLQNDPPPSPPHSSSSSSDPDDLFADIDRAIAQKRREFVDQGLLPPNPPPQAKEPVIEGLDELTPEEVLDLDEIRELQGLTIISADGDGDADSPQGKKPPKSSSSDDDDDGVGLDADVLESSSNGNSLPSLYGLDVDEFGKSRARILEPTFRMSLAELLDESKVVPVSVYGDLEVSITGIQHDSREVNAGDLFVCCNGSSADGLGSLTEADKRGAVAVVADKEINIDETLACKALVIVEDTDSVLPILAASFYKNPSKSLAVIGITGTHGITTTTHLIKAMYEAMGLRTGMMGILGHYVHGENKLEFADVIPNAVGVQKLMAKMVHNGTEAVVMEGSYNEVDYDIAVLTNLRNDHPEFQGSEEEYMNSKAGLFAKMVDPMRHRKVVNIDDPNAPFFVAKGNPDVPVVTYALENKKADVHALKYELSLFETQVLVQTPHGILEISSGLLGRENIYNILAAVAVGIVVGAPLEDIVRGIEEVDAVPGRCELIDEEQAFGVIVDHARTPDQLSRLLDTIRELGPRRIITDKSDVVMLTSDNPRSEDPLDILDDMLAGVGWTMQDYLKYGENDYYPPLPNGHRLFLHDIRRVAVRAAVAMGEEGDIVVVAGKGHETYQIEGDKEEFFDDREECREALHYVDELHQAGIDTSEFPWRLPESH